MVPFSDFDEPYEQILLFDFLIIIQQFMIDCKPVSRRHFQFHAISSDIGGRLVFGGFGSGSKLHQFFDILLDDTEIHLGRQYSRGSC